MIGLDDVLYLVIFTVLVLVLGWLGVALAMAFLLGKITTYMHIFSKGMPKINQRFK